MRFCSVIALGASLIAAPAFAQDTSQASQALYINGTAPAACVISGPSANSAVNAVISQADATHGQIVISQFVDAQTAQPVASDIRINLPVTCNASHRVHISSTRGGLLRDGGLRAGRGAFAEFVPYRIGLDWAGSQVDQASDGGPITVDAARGAVGELSLHVETPGGGNPLVAGQYDDSIIIQFEPAG
jgi:hypothetical protein